MGWDGADGGCLPKENPCRNSRLPGPGDAEGMGTLSAGPPYTISCEPSSAIAVEGMVPGRGKKTERLREWMRECRRVWLCEEMEGEGLMPFSFVRISGAVADAGSFPLGSPSAGNEKERGDGLAGENGPEIERARE